MEEFHLRIKFVHIWTNVDLLILNSAFIVFVIVRVTLVLAISPYVCPSLCERQGEEKQQKNEGAVEGYRDEKTKRYCAFLHIELVSTAISVCLFVYLSIFLSTYLHIYRKFCMHLHIYNLSFIYHLPISTYHLSFYLSTYLLYISTYAYISIIYHLSSTYYLHII